MVGFALYMGVTQFLNPGVPIQLQAANIFSWIGSVSFAFFLNRAFVFESHRRIRSEMVRFFGARVVTLITDMGIMFFSVSLFKWNDRFSKILSMVVVIVGNYALSKWFVFKNGVDKKAE